MNYDDVQSVKEIYWKQVATRRKELLKEIVEMLGYCPFCWANAKQDHADDCKLRGS